VWVTAERDRIVDEGDSAAAYLLAAEGGEIPEEEAKRLGYRAQQRVANKELEPENKAMGPYSERPGGNAEFAPKSEPDAAIGSGDGAGDGDQDGGGNAPRRPARPAVEKGGR